MRQTDYDELPSEELFRCYADGEPIYDTVSQYVASLIQEFLSGLYVPFLKIALQVESHPAMDERLHRATSLLSDVQDDLESDF